MTLRAHQRGRAAPQPQRYEQRQGQPQLRTGSRPGGAGPYSSERTWQLAGELALLEDEIDAALDENAATLAEAVLGPRPEDDPDEELPEGEGG